MNCNTFPLMDIENLLDIFQTTHIGALGFETLELDYKKEKCQQLHKIHHLGGITSKNSRVSRS